MQARRPSFHRILIFAAIAVAFVAGAVVTAVAQPDDAETSSIPAEYYRAATPTVLDMLLVRMGFPVAVMADKAGLIYFGFTAEPQDDAITWFFAPAGDTWDADLLATRMNFVVPMRLPEIPAECWSLSVIQDETTYTYANGEWTELESAD